MMKKIYLAITLCLAMTLSACGFKPQGEKQLAPPLHRLYLQTVDPYGLLVRKLDSYLKISGVHLASSPELADTILVLSPESTAQDLLSVSGTQQTRQYNLKLSVTFEITDTHGTVIVAPEAVAESRIITIQSNQILGSSNEATLYYQQMRRTLAYAIMNRIDSHDVTTTVMNAFEKKPAVKIAKGKRKATKINK
jgi:LPS-assembly lipoprotein